MSIKILVVFLFALFILFRAASQIHGQIDESMSPQSFNNYSFVVAGHAYGSHDGTNIGLYPKFLSTLKRNIAEDTKFLIFTGDYLRNLATEEKWKQFEKEVNSFAIPTYLVLGNNDNSKTTQQKFKDKYGGTFYSFDISSERFIVLDSQKESLSISKDQIDFLEENLDDVQNIDNIFVFFHELLWNDSANYKNIRANNRSSNDWENLKKSNYWEEVHPILENLKDKNIFVIAGDVGGRPDSIPAFYERIGNIRLVSSGMGEIEDENYLLATVTNGKVALNLIPLNKNNEIRELSYYNTENLSKVDPKTIFLQYLNKIKSIILLKTYWLGILTGLIISGIFIQAAVLLGRGIKK